MPIGLQAVVRRVAARVAARSAQGCSWGACVGVRGVAPCRAPPRADVQEPRGAELARGQRAAPRRGGVGHRVHAVRGQGHRPAARDHECDEGAPMRCDGWMGGWVARRVAPSHPPIHHSVHPILLYSRRRRRPSGRSAPRSSTVRACGRRAALCTRGCVMQAIALCGRGVQPCVTEAIALCDGGYSPVH